MKALTITNSFTVIAEVSNKHYMDNLFGILRCYCEVEANVERVDSYRITPESFWNGMNKVPDVDFIQLLKDNSEDAISPNVLTDLEKFKSRFGMITMVGDDCLKISNEDVLTEIKNNTRLNEMIYEYDGDLIFFSGDMKLLQEILNNDLSCPIKFRKSKMNTYLIDDGRTSEVVKAPNATVALRSLYGKHRSLQESQLRDTIKYRKAEVTEEAINEFIQAVLKDIKNHLVCMRQV